MCERAASVTLPVFCYHVIADGGERYEVKVLTFSKCSFVSITYALRTNHATWDQRCQRYSTTTTTTTTTSTVGIATRLYAEQPKTGGSNPGRAKTISLVHSSCPDRL